MHRKQSFDMRLIIPLFILSKFGIPVVKEIKLMSLSLGIINFKNVVWIMYVTSIVHKSPSPIFEGMTVFVAHYNSFIVIMPRGCRANVRHDEAGVDVFP